MLLSRSSLLIFVLTLSIRFEKQQEDIKVKGFFIMDDGQRSCDVVVKQKIKRGGAEAVKPPKMKDRGTQCNLDPEGNPIKVKKGPASKAATQDP